MNTGLLLENTEQSKIINIHQLDKLKLRRAIKDATSQRGISTILIPLNCRIINDDSEIFEFMREIFDSHFHFDRDGDDPYDLKVYPIISYDIEETKEASVLSGYKRANHLHGRPNIVIIRLLDFLDNDLFEKIRKKNEPDYEEI